MGNPGNDRRDGPGPDHRLGRDLSVRLPSGEDYVAQVSKEHRWLPVLAGLLPLPIPEPVALDHRRQRRPGALQVWETALARPWQQPPAWVHGDVPASNLLVAGGALHAVIDFGCAAVGDPACDLVMAWTFFSGQAAAVFRRCLPFHEATWARARGWALWKALNTLSGGH